MSLMKDMRLLFEVQQRLIELHGALALAKEDEENRKIGVLADTWNTLLELRDRVIRLIVINPDMAFAGGADALRKGLSPASDDQP